MPGGYPIANDRQSDPKKHRADISRTAESAMRGHINSVVDLDLDVSPATETLFSNAEIHPGSGFFIHPLDADASIDLHAGNINIFEADIGLREATVRHSANAATRTIRVAILG
jgi:hypothetical protein